MPSVSVRYIVNDVDEAIPSSCDQLGFEEVMHPRRRSRCSRAGISDSRRARPVGAPAAVRRCPTARCPRPVDDRFSIEVDDLEAMVGCSPTPVPVYAVSASSSS